MAETRHYAARARSTDTPGRMICTARDHHWVIDGPAWNGFPHEAVTPGESFLGAIAACCVEILQLVAAKEEVPLHDARVSVDAELDPDDQPHPQHTLFNRVRMRVEVDGPTEEQAAALVDRFKGR
ncbi:MAG TPA: OsmC family protein [Actinomycetota bacterium]|nr:OsmC family protein [Actinomycetota bacterium]